jgi:hypothetical protein
MAESGRKQTSFRCDEDLLNEFQVELRRRGVDMSPLIEGWIWEYVRGGRGRKETEAPVAPSPFGEITREEDRLLRAVLDLWRSDETHPLVRQFLQGILKSAPKN